MAKINILENNYPMDYREAFENLASRMFCVMLNLREGVNRPVNKKGIESDPVRVGSKVYAFQAKYYDAGTKLADKKSELIASVREARRLGVTDLVIFVNKDHTEDCRTGEKALYFKEIESEAQGTENEPAVNLDWWELSKIEQTLDQQEYQYIRDLYLRTDGTDYLSVSSFYEYIYKECLDDSESDLYGGMSLLDSYIEPTLVINGTDTKVRSYLEKWVEEGDPITVICGEPGHGKTSLCYKAMCDYYKNGWLAGKVSNVFCFSLNPANTNALSNDSLYLYALLSWGDDRQSNVITKEKCRGALIFFDGFDELKEWYPKLNLETFIKNYVVPFQKNTEAHIVITSRTMAVESEERSYTLRNRKIIPINKLQPITEEDQYKWIEKYIQHVRKSSPGDAAEIEKYYGEYKNLFAQQLTDADSLKELVGIPIIFRMIVTARYLPTKGQSVTDIYNNLFDVTWERHRRQDDKDPLAVKARLAEHALQIFIDNNDTAETDVSGSSTWLFSFYTTHEGKRRVGFLHRSFYQYFLAYEILSWYEKYAGDKKKDEFEDKLSYLGRRRLDKTTLTFIEKLYDHAAEKEGMGAAFDESYKILKETDGFLPLPEIKTDSEKMKEVTPLPRANNVFWSIVSVGGICGKGLLANSVNDICMVSYDLEGCILRNAKLWKKILRNVKLSRADLRGANLSGADLSGAELRATNFSSADLSGAKLRGANLRRASLFLANLRRTDLSDANLNGATLNGADLSGADLNGADLNGATLNGATLNR